MTAAPPRSYRSKLEVLRDFLRAAQEPVPKTRIIGAANLNPLSFRRYLRVCTERELITSVSGGYVATPRAMPLLEAIDSVMLKRDELERAVRVLERNTLDGPAAGSDGRNPSRRALRAAWNEIALRSAVPTSKRRRSAVVVTLQDPTPDPAPPVGPSWRRPERPEPQGRAVSRRPSSSRGSRAGGRSRSLTPRPRSRR